MMRLTLLVVLAMPILALAHALLERASPPVGSELAEPPRQLTLTFTEGIEPLFSTIELRTANGAAVPCIRGGIRRQLSRQPFCRHW